MGTIATAIILGSAIAGVGAVAASGINAASQSSTNKRQEDMFHDQMAYQTSEREAMQAYNNPVNQRKRLEAAGINPYFAMSGIDAGNTTAQSSPAVPQIQAPQFGDILKSLSGSLSDGLQNYNQFEQNQQMQLGIDQMKVDTKYKLVEKLLQLDNMRAELAAKKTHTDAEKKQMDLYDKQIERLGQDIKFFDMTADEQKAKLVADRKISEADADLAELKKEYQSWFNDYQKKFGEAQINEIKSVIADNMSQVEYNKKLSQKAMADKIVSEREAKGIRLDNYPKRRLNPLIREQVKLGNEYQTYTNDNFWKTKFVDIFGTGAVTAGAAYLGAKGAKGGSPRAVKGFTAR